MVNMPFWAEAASLTYLKKGVTEIALTQIVDVGYATELLTHRVSFVTNVQYFQDPQVNQVAVTKVF